MRALLGNHNTFLSPNAAPAEKKKATTGVKGVTVAFECESATLIFPVFTPKPEIFESDIRGLDPQTRNLRIQSFTDFIPPARVECFMSEEDHRGQGRDIRVRVCDVDIPGERAYVGTSPMRTPSSVGPYSSPVPRDLW